MSEPKQVINVCVPVTFRGRYYKGITLHDGVGIEFISTCNPDSKAVKLSNCHPAITAAVQPMCSAISNAEVAEAHDWAHEFLQIVAITAVAE